MSGPSSRRCEAPLQSTVLGPQRGGICGESQKLMISCGLEPGVAERLDQEAPDWRTSGKFAVISFAPKTA